MNEPVLSHLATALLFIRDGKILLLHRTNTGYLDDQYALVGGKVDEGDSIIQSAVCEGFEEVGAIIKPHDLEFVHVLHRRDQKINWVLFFFLVHSWQGVLTNKEPHKHGHMDWFPLTALPEKMVATHAQAIEAWKEKKIFSLYPQI